MTELANGLAGVHDEFLLPWQGVGDRTAAPPRTLLITCAASCARDSVLASLDGMDVLTLRLAANRLPPASLTAGRLAMPLVDALTFSTIGDIIVCGHSLCGHLKQPAALPATPRGPDADDLMKRIHRNIAESDSLLARVQDNVRAQLRTLQSYPAVAKAMACRGLRLHGWVYLDQSGLILSHDAARDEFVPLAERENDWPEWEFVADGRGSY